MGRARLPALGSGHTNTRLSKTNTTTLMRAMMQQVLGLLVLILALVNAQDYFTLNDDEIQRNFTIQPRASGTYPCKKKAKAGTLSVGDVATFTSPGYPADYTSKSKCQWLFKSSDPSGKVSVTCSSFTLQPTNKKGKCQNDFLRLGLEKFCGNNGPVVVTKGSSMKILFKSNKKANYAGFTCTAQVFNCTTNAPVTNAPVTNAPVTNSPSGRCVCGKANRATRIVGGETTMVNEYPWQVALVSRGSSSVFCGGSLINDRWVLTAAHCTQSGVQQVLLGNHFQSTTDSTERRINVRRVVDHPNYNDRTLNNDFSLLELSSPVDLKSVDPGIRPVCLPSASNPTQYEDVPSVVSGWGTTSSGGSQPNALRDVVVRTMSNSACSGSYGGAITNAMICAANPGKDSCQGDSGGPLVRNVGGYFNQIGVVSWGSGCADVRFPGVYSRVTNAINWITSTSSSGQTCAPPS